MEYQNNYRPTKEDLKTLQVYVASKPAQKMPEEITKFIEQKREIEKQQRDLSLLIG